MIGYDGPVGGLVAELEAWYPGWHFAVRQCHGGPRIEAWRPDTSSTRGLYAVITDSLPELRAELDAAAVPVSS